MDYIITGAGSGMGRSTAIILSARDAARIILVGRHEKTLQETRNMCKNPEQHLIVELDIRDAHAWETALNRIQDLNLHGLFANAGAGGGNEYGHEDRWDEIISINLTGTYVTIQESLPFLKKCSLPWRNILITSSCLARFGVPGYTAYCTSKTGLLGLTRSLALETAGDQILVNALCPGWVHTDMAIAGIQKLAHSLGNDYETEFAAQMDLVPLKKISEPNEIGRWVEFLFLGEQNSMTGQAIDINNGSFMG